jgi:fatty acid desaturase
VYPQLKPRGKPPVQDRDDRYVDLKHLVVKSGLTHKEVKYYALRISLNLFLLGFGIACICTVGNTWLQLLNSAYLAFVFTQIGFIVHDSGHQQIFSSAWKNNLVSLVHANLLLGFSSAWWVNTHNRHHSRPNQLDCDPDIEFVVLAFSEEQAERKRGIARFMVKHQAYFFFPLLLLEAFSLKFESLRFLVSNKVRHGIAEWGCIFTNYLVSSLVVFKFLGFVKGIGFIIVNQSLFGLFLGLIFVTNHKGMPLLNSDSRMDFLERQVITARNLKACPVTDYLFGGLSCQIEHHLFPTIPLNNLRKTQTIVRSYCQSRGVAYYETGLFQSYCEVLQHLNEVGASLRASRKRYFSGHADTN